MIIFIAVKCLLASKWKYSSIQSIDDWYLKIWIFFLMDKLASISASSKNYMGFSNVLEKLHPFFEFTTNDLVTRRLQINQRYSLLLFCSLPLQAL